MSETTHPINTKKITEMTQIGVAMSGHLEEILLHDPLSLAFKEHQSAIVDIINTEIDLENLSALFQKEQLMLDKLEEHEFAEKKAIAEEKQKTSDETTEESREGAEKLEHKLTPTKILLPNILEILENLLSLYRQFKNTQDTVAECQTNQQAINSQWMMQQSQEANRFLQKMKNAPVLLPNGTAIPNLSIEFNSMSPEALALKERLAAAPMMPDLLNKLEHTDMRQMYDKQVKIHAQQMRNSQPDIFAQDSAELELAAHQKAIEILNLNGRQLQNKFLLSVTAIHDYLKRIGVNHIETLVQQYNNALGIGHVTPHKRMGIYQILNHTISPYLTPTLTMGNKKSNRNEIENDNLQINAMRLTLQESRLQQQNLARLSTMRALVATLRNVATQSAEFAFLNDICDRIATPTLKIPTRKNNFRLVPKGYNILS